MEECENKYNEALKRAAIIYKGEDKSLKESLEQIFPELKESEDEKIRKWIINEIKVKHHNLDEDNVDFVDKAIAWLEKQGEQKPDYCHHKVDLSNCSEEYRKAYYDGWNNCNMQHFQCESEKNHVWREEDEKERKRIIGLLEGWLSTFKETCYAEDCKRGIAWLEKQCEPNPYSGTSFEYNGHTWGMCARDGGVEIGYDRNLKAFLSPEKSFIYSNNHSQGPTAPESVMEAVKEGNVSNSVKEDKLKFKIGDWIVNPKGEALHITDIDGSCYVFNNNKSHFWITCYCDQQCHLWNIEEDARDGDILCTYECNEPKIVFTLKGTPKKHYALGYYFYYNLMYSHLEPESDGGGLAPEEEDVKVKPATKWQRDILQQKLKEAGYKWDSENRKLIKE